MVIQNEGYAEKLKSVEHLTLDDVVKKACEVILHIKARENYVQIQ